MSEPEKTAYQTVAEIIYGEKPALKEKLNLGAQFAIDTLKEALPTEVTNKDLEVIFALIAYIMSDLLITPAHGLSEKLDLTFDTYSLAAGAVAGELDLGDTSAAKTLAEVIQAAKDAHRDADDQPTPGQYL